MPGVTYRPCRSTQADQVPARRARAGWDLLIAPKGGEGRRSTATTRELRAHELSRLPGSQPWYLAASRRLALASSAGASTRRAVPGYVFRPSFTFTRSSTRRFLTQCAESPPPERR